MSTFLDHLSNLLLSTKKRIDHNPMYVCIMVWDLFAGAYAISVGLPDSAMTRMSGWAQAIICWLMFVGGLATVGGATMGTKLDPGYWIRPHLGKTNQIDVRIPYLLGLLGTPMLMVSFFFYSIAIFIQMPWASTMASEASLALAVGAGSAINFLRFALELRSIELNLPGLIAREVDMQLTELRPRDGNTADGE